MSVNVGYSGCLDRGSIPLISIKSELKLAFLFVIYQKEGEKLENKIVQWAEELQSIAQAGLWYGKDRFDLERYERLRELSIEMMSDQTDLPKEKIKTLFANEEGYQTPKVDTRAAIIQKDKILLVQELDGRWSLPGGWCEFNLSPVKNTIKEAKEEAGLEIEVLKLIAAQDRNQHNLPIYAYDVVKLFYLCEVKSGQFKENSETTASQYFSLEELPDLSEEKVTKEQLKLCFEAYYSEKWEAQFD